MKLIFATHNDHKLNEVRSILGEKNSISGLKEVGCFESINETGNTLKENSLLKAKLVHEKFNTNCFSEDTGLEVEAIGNKPGVLSARFAGDDRNSEKNIEKLLSLLENKKNRNARFRTVVTLVYENKFYFVEGKVNGVILNKKRGINGFGYDPVFCPTGFDKSFGEISAIHKNMISHRSIAFIKLKKLIQKF
ncbi:MAG: RdgB/HAM1 family non-canonical purine NTP pyrophosphatase [Flavobacteriaceae bacterium]|jgi:XTP/dITP diphosphohydrolase|nr:RdgB/HAM1 family non-canonical purine NTP pyrophosphatase [Flavobacteriaceae bacterium]